MCGRQCGISVRCRGNEGNIGKKLKRHDVQRVVRRTGIVLEWLLVDVIENISTTGRSHSFGRSGETGREHLRTQKR